MRSIARLTSVGLLTALAVATFVACKKEKEQNGPDIIVGSGTTVRAQDTIIIGQPRLIIIELSVKKGSGKDDADLKTYSCVVRRDGSTTGDGYSNRNAPNGTAFTIRDTFPFDPQSPTTYEITYTVTDKNDKSATRSFRISFVQSGQGNQPTYRLESATYTVDTLSNMIFFTISGTQGSFSQTGAGGVNASNAGNLLFAYYYSPSNRHHSLIDPTLLGTTNYTNPSLNVNASGRIKTTFYIASSSYDLSDATDLANQIRSLTQLTKFVGNTDGTRALIGGSPPSNTNGPHKYVGFIQVRPTNDTILGVVEVKNFNSITNSATPNPELNIKVVFKR